MMSTDSPIKGVHHINFLFRDLEAAVRHFEKVLGIGPFEHEALEERGVRTARARVGETWFVLVSPTRADSMPGRHLEERGEGFFLISFGVDDLGQAIAALEGSGDLSPGPQRRGVGGWRIADLPAAETLGIAMQLTEDSR